MVLERATSLLPVGRRKRVALLAVAVWCVVALVAGAQIYVAARLEGRAVGLAEAWTANLFEVAIFAAASPLIYVSALRFPIRGSRRWAHLSLHLVAGLVFVMALNVIAVVPWAVAREGAVTVGEFFGTAAYGFTTHVHAALVVYFVIVAIGHVVGRQRSPDDAAERHRSALERLTVEREGRVKLVPAEEVDWIEAAGDELRVHVRDEVYRLRERLKTMEERLDPARFARIHRSTIVNLDRVDELSHFSHGDYDVLLEDGTRLRMSRSYRDRVLGSAGGG